MKVKGNVCPSCGDFIYSRTRHDYRSCSCKGISIDGGTYNKETDSLSYERVIWESDKIDAESITPKEIELNLIYAEVYADWNLSKDKLGLIKKSIDMKDLK